MSSLPFVALDTETTGLSRDSHLVEIGAVKFRGNLMIDTLSTLIKPPIPIPRSATRIHGITNHMVKNAPSFGDVAERFLNFIDGAVIVAHNAPFDVLVIGNELERLGISIPDNPVIDTCKLSKSLFPELPSHKLEYLGKVWKSPVRGFHRALKDARNVAYIFKAMLVKCGMAQEMCLEELSRIVPVKKFSDIFKRNLWTASRHP